MGYALKKWDMLSKTEGASKEKETLNSIYIRGKPKTERRY